MQEPEIFTKHVKPFFAYWNPAHAKVKSMLPPPPGTTVRMSTDHYKHVEPGQAMTRALQGLQRVGAGPSLPPVTERPPTNVVFTPDF